MRPAARASSTAALTPREWPPRRRSSSARDRAPARMASTTAVSRPRASSSLSTVAEFIYTHDPSQRLSKVLSSPAMKHPGQASARAERLARAKGRASAFAGGQGFTLVDHELWHGEAHPRRPSLLRPEDGPRGRKSARARPSEARPDALRGHAPGPALLPRQGRHRGGAQGQLIARPDPGLHAAAPRGATRGAPTTSPVSQRERQDLVPPG